MGLSHSFSGLRKGELDAVAGFENGRVWGWWKSAPDAALRSRE